MILLPLLLTQAAVSDAPADDAMRSCIDARQPRPLDEVRKAMKGGRA